MSDSPSTAANIPNAIPAANADTAATVTDARWRARVRSGLLDWFAENARDLPWRRDPSPYRVWVSEIMCQQTQVATVVPYFLRFLKRYPDATALAKADESELMRIWEGLGYYRRARSMHAAAKQIVEIHDGAFPLQYRDAIALPGIGRYTAGAILSISSNLPLPILEGNTIRVFSRLIAMRDSVDEKSSQETLWTFSEQLLPRRFSPTDRSRGPASLNQAAMELGALICTPREPKCLICPVAKMCRTRAAGLQAEIPAKTQKTKYEARSEYAALVGDNQGRWLVRQIPPGNRFAGMWDFPKAGPPDASNAEHFQGWLSGHLGGEIRLVEMVKTMKHAVTKFRITLNVYRATRTGGPKKLANPWAFRSPEQLRHLPMSTTGRRLLNWVEKNHLK
ncbi:A/G-specific adenine glycosylase [Aporhodopirellula aestuarii]|uniref:Adenine DNA glycosylase n=1 Tax=Aporhodopirellula aestuarii TaxID=2950107 RepID=A0ABT0U0S9_9BACT|nr:A/G-specific adenine glycosylase [Aporhodopirellula aestuarii]MCM2370431.1 A/G-specific adenine glycosylase [Aporhodopirellula aestuarii]